MPIPEYILGLRGHVGHELLWLPGVCAVVLDDEGRVLLGQRSDNGRWALVAGFLEPGEQPAAGIVREVLEETGVEVRVEGIAAVGTYPPVEYPNGDRAQYVTTTFVCRPVSADSARAAHVADDESLAVGWFAPDDLPDGLSAGSRDRLRAALEWVADPSHGPWFAR
ncbi:NUDIX domain-containing protein [Antribacter sp. KLBMP9083]|uniref:NUDIX domain-containing protein n=1 Tax=Antribacter soli TaxID=2910976 RepID=A0AA41QHH1_9MICO|nr:NUDIX domain-containing protein [Antribacter soli]MCF4123161.1 NUDIX domain-containing protein [Antribacter soli]